MKIIAINVPKLYVNKTKTHSIVIIAILLEINHQSK